MSMHRKNKCRHVRADNRAEQGFINNNRRQRRRKEIATASKRRNRK